MAPLRFKRLSPRGAPLTRFGVVSALLVLAFAVVNGNRALQAGSLVLFGAGLAIAFAIYHIRQSRRIRALEQEASAARLAQRAAEDDAKDKSRALATTSHEIRTPLNGVIGMLTLLGDSVLSPQQRNYAETAQASARTLLSIVDEVLDAAKVENRRARGQVPVDVATFVEGVTELLAPRAHAKGLQMSSRIAPSVPRELALDELHLRQILFNLAGNAIKFTEQGGVALEVECHKPGMLQVTVRDTGIGMTAEEASRVFGEFEQASTTTSARFGGTGLGLAISRRLAVGMGGTLTLTSVPGQGSRFVITLPVDPAVAPPPVWQPLARRRYALAMEAGITRDHLAQTLKELGADVVLLSGAKDLATHLAAPQPADQLICGSPHFTALRKWARKHKVKPQGLPVVWIVLKPEERNQNMDLLRAPFAGYLLSPLRRATLLAQLSAHDGRSLKQTSAALRAAQVPGKAKPTAATSAMSILLAEDNPVNALLTRTILEKNGHTVRVAADGAEALELLRSAWPCDLAVMDVEMPRITGTKLATMLRSDEALAHRRTLPLLAMTANVRAEDVAECLAAGFNEHMPKPFDRHVFEERIAALAAQAHAA